MKKAYCFTLNNYTEEQYVSITETLRDLSEFAIVGREVGDERGTPHLQGYCRFKAAYRWNTVKDRLLPGCHIEVARGSARSNREYCSKSGDYVEYGSIPEAVAGSSTREDQARRFVQGMEQGRHGLDEFAAEYPGTWYFSGHNLLRNFMALQRAESRPGINVRWFYGPPGAGKSRSAHETLPEAFVKEPRSKWWNGYFLEKEVIIDDYGHGCVDINHLLRWFDRYKCYVENKGGMLPLKAETFIVTSNFHPRELFKSVAYRIDGATSSSVDEEHPQLGALMRRIECIEFFNN